MIDALFGSKTRVKLLHLFLNNPGKSFYVREITRLVDEQINSVRRELSNMLSVGIITSDSANNKLYYEVNQRYEYYVPLRAIFGDEPVTLTAKKTTQRNWEDALESLTGARIILVGGVLVKGSAGTVDLLIVGDTPSSKTKAAIALVEKTEGREINYATIGYDEFYYRLSVRDRFITDIVNNKHRVIIDTDNVLNDRK